MIKMNTLIGASALALTAGMAFAEGHGCGIESGRISILSNDFPALRAVVERAGTCATDGIEFSANQTTEHKDIQVAALSANPSEYTAAVVANGSVLPLLNEGLIRPLDDLIAEHGQSLSPTQLITIDGRVMAVAFMANAQHLFVRTDILEEAGVEIPTTYEEVIEAAAAIEEAGIMEDPFAMNTQVGWNLAEEFVNMYLGYGGEFFEPGSANVAINNEAGIAALEMLRSLNEYADPDFLTFDSNATSALWESGEIAIAMMWGSRGASILDDEGSTEEVTSTTQLVGAPTVGGGERPASTLWWDGFTIASNVSDEDAEATFIAMVNGIDPAVMEGNMDAAVWLIEGYQPGAAAEGVAATAQSGTAPYPMLPYMGLLHTALGNELADFMQGSESAEQALADTEAAYTTAAREQGYVE